MRPSRQLAESDVGRAGGPVDRLRRCGRHLRHRSADPQLALLGQRGECHRRLRDRQRLFEDSEVSRNNWRGWAAEHKGFDTVGKWSESRDVIDPPLPVHRQLGHGLWFDGDNQRVLVEEVFSARNGLRGIFLEYNGGPITIQDSKFCENGLAGVSNARSNNTTPVITTKSSTTATTRSLGHRQPYADYHDGHCGRARNTSRPATIGPSPTTSSGADRWPAGTRPTMRVIPDPAGGRSGRRLMTTIFTPISRTR